MLAMPPEWPNEGKAAVTLLALLALVACAWLISKGWKP